MAYISRSKSLINKLVYITAPIRYGPRERRVFYHRREVATL